jgi:hypothetical protein
VPPFPQRYADTFRGWPVQPQNQQHPVRATFLDPRPDPDFGAIYHTGVDVAVRDDRPEAGAPPGRTHRVFAIEGGVVEEATARGVRGNVRIGHFGYGHIDARVSRGDRVRAGQMIGWTTRGSWHVHLTEFHFPGDGRRLLLNPLRPGGKLKPFVDTAPPAIHEVRFYTPAEPKWGRRVGNVAELPQAGRRLDRTRLAGTVDVRAHVSDPQSFLGWFRNVPVLAAPHHPYRIGLLLVERGSGRVVLRRTVYIALGEIGIAAGQHYAPGTKQNLPAQTAVDRGISGAGIYWFRLFQRPYWDTRRLPNGRYLLVVRAWDAAGNRARRDIEIAIANAPQV